MRPRIRPIIGEIWRSSDPRRLYAFRIVGYDEPDDPFWVVVENIQTGRRAVIDVDKFAVTGSKGYTRVS